ncbi:hypothetical protein [Mycobacterium branderi]|nr:hypothetical protein [Mycobacterium branderi]MCV7236384.1 hypothetical protein [Mycobacterium branderi]
MAGAGLLQKQGIGTVDARLFCCRQCRPITSGLPDPGVTERISGIEHIKHRFAYWAKDLTQICYVTSMSPRYAINAYRPMRAMHLKCGGAARCVGASEARPAGGPFKPSGRWKAAHCARRDVTRLEAG